MKKIILTCFLLSLAVSVYARQADKLVAVEKPDGSVAIVNYFQNSQKSLQEVIQELGFSSYPQHEVTQDKLPPGRIDRAFWTWKTNKVDIDQAKKAQAQAEENQKQAKKTAALAKMGITGQELKEALYKEF